MSSLKSIIRQRKAENSLGEFKESILLIIETEVKNQLSKMKKEIQAEIEPWINDVVETILKEQLRGERGERGLPGRDGKTPLRGVDYLTPQDIALITNTIQSNLKLPKDGKDGKDVDENAVVEKIMGEVRKNVSKFLESVRPRDGKDGFIETEETLFTKLMRSNKKIPIEKLDGWEEFKNGIMSEVKRLSRPIRPVFGGGGDVVEAGSNVTITRTSGGKRQIAATSGGITILTATGTINGSNADFSFVSEPTVIVVNGVSYRKNVGWTWSAGTLTATLDSAPQTGSDVYGL